MKLSHLFVSALLVSLLACAGGNNRVLVGKVELSGSNPGIELISANGTKVLLGEGSTSLLVLGTVKDRTNLKFKQQDLEFVLSLPNKALPNQFKLGDGKTYHLKSADTQQPLDLLISTETKQLNEAPVTERRKQRCILSSCPANSPSSSMDPSCLGLRETEVKYNSIAKTLRFDFLEVDSLHSIGTFTVIQGLQEEVLEFNMLEPCHR